MNWRQVADDVSFVIAGTIKYLALIAVLTIGMSGYARW